MSSVRDIVLRRAKQPAKVMAMEAGNAASKPMVGPTVVEYSANDLGGASGGGAQPSAPAQRGSGGYGKSQASPGPPKPPKPPGSAGNSSRGRNPGKSSEARRPRPTSEPAREQPARGARSSSVPRRGLSGDPPPVERKDVGKVPAYLKKRQDEMAEAKRQAALPSEPKAPPGYRKIGDSEKEESLGVLRKRKAEAEKQQQKLPFNIETPGQKKREQEIKDRIAHLDKLIGMFSKPTVFYPVDADSIADTFPPLDDYQASKEVPRTVMPGMGPPPDAPSPRRCAPVSDSAPFATRATGTPEGRPGRRESPARAALEARQQQQHQQHTSVNVSNPPGGKSSLSLMWGD